MAGKDQAHAPGLAAGLDHRIIGERLSSRPVSPPTPAAGMLGRVDRINPSEVVSRLAALRREHRDLDAEIEQRVADLQADELTVKRLKKRKLWLKDCIARLESTLIPDEPA